VRVSPAPARLRLPVADEASKGRFLRLSILPLTGRHLGHGWLWFGFNDTTEKVALDLFLLDGLVTETEGETVRMALAEQARFRGMWERGGPIGLD